MAFTGAIALSTDVNNKTKVFNVADGGSRVQVADITSDPSSADTAIIFVNDETTPAAYILPGHTKGIQREGNGGISKIYAYAGSGGASVYPITKVKI